MNSSDALKDHLLMNGRHKNIQMDPTSPAYRLILLRASELSQIPIPLRVDDGDFFHVGISSHSSKRHRATHIV